MWKEKLSCKKKNKILKGESNEASQDPLIQQDFGTEETTTSVSSSLTPQHPQLTFEEEIEEVKFH